MIAVTLVFLCQGHQVWPDLGLTPPPTQTFTHTYTQRERHTNTRTLVRTHACTHITHPPTFNLWFCESSDQRPAFSKTAVLKKDVLANEVDITAFL